jgi:hypothetical protein
VLIAIATDTQSLIADEPDCWAPLHALRLLIALPDISMIEPLLGVVPVPWGGEYDDPGFLWVREAPHALAVSGGAAIPVLWQWFDDAAHNHSSKTIAMEALVLATVHQAPEARAEMIKRLRALLVHDEDILIRSQAMRCLANLSAREAYSEVMQALREKRVDTEYMSPAEARQRLLSKYVAELDDVLLDFWDRYEVYGPFDPDELPDYYDDY